MALSARILTLRRSPILLKLPPYLSALLIVVGISWMLLLPLNGYSRQTYISENAILPGQVNTHFGGSEHNVFRAYRQEIYSLAQKSESERIEGMRRILRAHGLKDAAQSFDYHVAGEQIAGVNAYGILQGPRTDATEAMVLVAAFRNGDGEINYSGVALTLTLARYFSRWSVWSKDIIVLIPADSTYGPMAWVDAYHSTSITPTASRNISALPIKAGALQAAVALDYPVGPWGQRFDKLDVLYDGINGALPNLDLLNTAVSIASGQMGIGCSLHGLKDHGDGYADRLRTIAAGILTQGIGHSTGPHSAFMPYRIDAITLKTVGDGWHDEMSLGRVTESTFRSINNLLEHLHQSFFFYILLNANRFVSIGNYLPAAMLVAGSFTITALALWIQSGRPETPARFPKSGEGKDVKMQVVKEGNDIALVPQKALQAVERKLFLPATLVLIVHLTSLLPLYLFTHVSLQRAPTTVIGVALFAQGVAAVLPVALRRYGGATKQQFRIVQSFSLLFLGAALSTTATLNFSLALAVGLVASPLSFVRSVPAEWYGKLAAWQGAVTVLVNAGLWAISPPAVLCIVSKVTGQALDVMLHEMAKGWTGQGAFTCLIVWSIWWPAWLLSAVVLYSEMPFWEARKGST